MCATWRMAMEKMLLSSQSFRNSRLRRACMAGMTLVMALVLSNTAFGQEIQVSGTVTKKHLKAARAR